MRGAAFLHAITFWFGMHEIFMLSFLLCYKKFFFFSSLLCDLVLCFVCTISVCCFSAVWFCHFYLFFAACVLFFFGILGF